MSSSSFKYSVIILLFFGVSNSYSQGRKIVNYTEVGGLIHLSNTFGSNAEFNGFRTRTGITRIISKNYGLGFALGTDNYKRSTGATFNTLPITLNAAYYFNPELTGFKLDAYGGYSIKLFDNLNRGLTAGAGLSYSVAVNDGLNLGVQTGYNYQEIDYPSTFVQEGFNLGSFRIGLGITFK
ncbi:hypothetical protein [Daejeonella sp.]|uniref:hypothetical protein n=1 Tax=Daejeonella sp. TaxID=2805397 RepID=UPI0030BE63A1